MDFVDLVKIKAPYHWHPNEDYCIRCERFIDHWVNSKTLVVECACSYEEMPHYVRQKIHHLCLSEVKKEMNRDKIFVWEAFKHLKIELPLR